MASTPEPRDLIPPSGTFLRFNLDPFCCGPQPVACVSRGWVSWGHCSPENALTGSRLGELPGPFSGTPPPLPFLQAKEGRVGAGAACLLVTPSSPTGSPAPPQPQRRLFERAVLRNRPQPSGRGVLAAPVPAAPPLLHHPLLPLPPPPPPLLPLLRLPLLPLLLPPPPLLSLALRPCPNLQAPRSHPLASGGECCLA